MATSEEAAIDLDNPLHHWQAGYEAVVDDTDTVDALAALIDDDDAVPEDDAPAPKQQELPLAPPVGKSRVRFTQAEEEELVLAKWSNLRLKLDTDTAAAMVSGDVPMDAVMAVRVFSCDLTTCVQPYLYEWENIQRNYLMLAQLQELDSWADRCLSGKFPETLVISGTPNDSRAKAIAAYLFARAVQTYQDDPGTFMSRRVGLPRWHQVIGGFNDAVVKEKREKKAESDPLLWVFSNVMDDSTSAKVENLRDSLQLYAHRPRIIVTSNTNPRAFMNRLRIGAAAHLYVR